METIVGRVKYTHGFKSFTLVTSSKEEVRVNHNLFFPVKENDSVVAQIERTNSGNYIRGSYLAIILDDDETILDFMISQLRWKKVRENQVRTLFYELKKMTAKQPLNDYINQLAWDYHVGGNIDTVIDKVKPYVKDDAFKTLLRDWLKLRVRRALWLLGFPNRTILKSDKPWHLLHKAALENPYKEICISMELCQQILNKIGKKAEEKDVYCGAAIRYLNDNMIKYGWTYTPFSLLIQRFPNIVKYGEYFIKEYNVHPDTLSNGFYLKSYWQIETTLVDFFTELIKLIGNKPPVKVDFVHDNLSEDQKEAVVTSLSSPLSFIIGAAGTGKTTIIKELVYQLKNVKKDYRLLAYTGKAAMRISEVTKETAQTIHMFLEKINSNDKDIGTIIIDEISMVTSELIYRLITELNKLGKTPQFIFLGDPNQLLPIDAGFFLRELLRVNEYLTSKREVKKDVVEPTDFIEKKEIKNTSVDDTQTVEVKESISLQSKPEKTIQTCFPVSRLIHNHRCYTVDGEIDGVILNANRICTQTFSKVEETVNFKHVTDTLKNTIEKLYSYNIKPGQFTIISPYKDLEDINSLCQSVFNGKSDKVIDINKKMWAVGDPVICTKNMYDIDLFNGEQGTIISISQWQIKVKFLRGEHLFDLPSANDRDEKEEEAMGEKKLRKHTRYLLTSYAMTVHRSQGSEWDFVIFYLPSYASAKAEFINRNLVYTAITRARRGVYIIGNLNVFTNGAKLEAQDRYEYLSNRILHSLGYKIDMLPEKEIKVLAPTPASYDDDDGYEFDP